MAGERYATWRPIWSQFSRSVRDASTFSGRSRRSDLVCYYVISGVVGQCLESLFFPRQMNEQGLVEYHWGHWLLIALILIPMPALIVRRFHDQGRSGWWAILAMLGWAGVAAMSHIFPSGLAVWLTLVILAAILILLVLMLGPGTAGANRFGPDPRLGNDI